MKHDINYPSSDGKTQIHAIIWEPEDTPKAILQICHGMVDYADRYNDFAQHAAIRGTMWLPMTTWDTGHLLLPTTSMVISDTQMAMNASLLTFIHCEL